VFERFTEQARRCIFFARYEASVYPTSFIEPEHLLLGILREYPELPRHLPVEEFRAELARKFPRGETLATSVDLPLNHQAKRALARGAKEADRLGHKQIDCGHLVLGLIHESAFVAELLREWGIGTAAIEEMLAHPAPVAPMQVHGAVVDPLDPLVEAKTVVRRLVHLFRSSESQLFRFSEAEAEFLVGPKRWSRKEALGHLIDCATTHLHWIARALTEPKPLFSGYPQDEWIAAMGYKTFVWREMVPLWGSLNALLAHTIAGIPEEKNTAMCRVGIEPPVALTTIIDRYVAHCEEVMAEILTVGHHA
jgi:hypothetical protein